MIKKTNLLILVITSLISTACVQVPVTTNSKANQLAITSVRDLPLTYPQGSLFSLSPKYVKETSLKGEQIQAIYRLYTNAIVNELHNNGFSSAATAQQADFYVGFGIAFSEDFSDDQLSKKFGITPGLPEQSNLKKGSFLIYIEDATTGQRVWRGVAQGFAHQELSDEQRQQRSAVIVSSVMQQFYQTN